MKHSVKVKAPATIANVGCGFDVIGLALNEPFDTLDVELMNNGIIELVGIEGGDDLSLNPRKNVVGVVLQEVINNVGKGIGFRVKLTKGIAPGSGIGSSAASAAGAAYAANLLLENRFTSNELIRFAMEGERLASGSAHADNVAPSLLGGITLVRSYSPLDVISLASPKSLCCVVIHPDIEVKTFDSRRVLRQNIPLKTAVQQWGNVGGLVASLYREDYELMSRSLTDYVAEPFRSALIPGFDELKRVAIESGALGMGISGSGPSVFALCKGEETALRVCKEMEFCMQAMGLGFKSYVSDINLKGATTLK